LPTLRFLSISLNPKKMISDVLIKWSKIQLSHVYLQNLIEIPSLYHRQWAPHYPLYVLLDYNGDKHYIRLRKHNNKFYFADGLKGFRRTMGIHKGVMITFVVPEKNWMFHIHFMPPLHRKTCGRPLATTRTHVFTVDVTQRLISRTYPLVSLWSCN